jgi:hypothetical protein
MLCLEVKEADEEEEEVVGAQIEVTKPNNVAKQRELGTAAELKQTNLLW